VKDIQFTLATRVDIAYLVQIFARGFFSNL